MEARTSFIGGSDVATLLFSRESIMEARTSFIGGSDVATLLFSRESIMEARTSFIGGSDVATLLFSLGLAPGPHRAPGSPGSPSQAMNKITDLQLSGKHHGSTNIFYWRLGRSYPALQSGKHHGSTNIFYWRLGRSYLWGAYPQPARLHRMIHQKAWRKTAVPEWSS